MTAPFERPHWQADKAALGRTQGHLMLRLDSLYDVPPVLLADLAKPPFAGYRWSVRQSGTRVPGPRAEALEVLWSKRTRGA